MIDYEWAEDFAYHKTYVFTDGTITPDEEDDSIWYYSGETYVVENDSLVTESVDIKQGLNSDMQLRFGSCESASLSFTYDAQVTGSLLGKTVKAFLIPNHHSTEMLLLGVFRVEEEKLSNDRVYRTITAYDAMYDILNADVMDWYNTLLPTASNSVSVTMAQFRASFLNHFGVTAEAVNLINDDFIIRRTLDADKESLSGAEVIKAICEFNGVFGMITHEGKFRFLTLLPATTEERTEIARSAYYDLQYEDFYTKQISTLVVYSDYAKATHTGYTQGGVYVISGNFLMAQYNAATLKVLADNIYPKMANAIYKPCSIQTVGNPLHEVGDPIKIITKEGFINTYIFERRLHGIQALRDTYSANGEINTYQALNSTASRLREINASQTAQAEALANSDTDFVETIRNIGFRLLDEPTNVSAEYNENTGNVEITWTDPDDISTNEPVPCTWAGTVVVRKEDSAPRHRWDGELIVDSTTKDEYSSTALEDSTVQGEKNYFYGIFPYHVYLDDTINPIKHYRYTKSVKVSIGEISYIDLYTIQSFISSDGIAIIIDFTDRSDINNVTSVRLLEKKSSVPTTSNYDLSSEVMPAFELTGYQDRPTKISGVIYLGLDANSTYNFKPFTVKNSVDYESRNTALQTLSSSSAYTFTFGTDSINITNCLPFYGAHETSSEYKTNYLCLLVYPNDQSIASIKFYIPPCTQETSTKTGYLYVRSTPSGSNIESYSFSGMFREGHEYTYEFQTPITSPVWLVFHDPLNTGWTPALYSLTFYCN